MNDIKIDVSRIAPTLPGMESFYKVNIHNLGGLLTREGAQLKRYGLYLGDIMKALSAENGNLNLGNVTVNISGPFVGGFTPILDKSWKNFFESIVKIVKRYRGVKRGPQPKWITQIESAARNFGKGDDVENLNFSRSPALRSLAFLALEITDEVSRVFTEVKALISPMWRDIRYLGPLRDQPRRYYQFDDTGGADVGVSGEFTVQILALEKYKHLTAKQVAKISSEGVLFSDPVECSLLEHTNHWLSFMGLPSVTPSSLEQSLYKLEVGDLAVGLVDVGFGVSQVLPIIVEALRAERGDLVILEQPEIHLHPRVQAMLGDFLLARSMDGVRFLVESHSEYLVKRLCRRLAEARDTCVEEATSIFFVEGAPGEASCKKIKINKYGEIENWPKGFFDLDEDLYWAQASLRKRMLLKLD
ncbi:MAG: hypothetical protein EpisKO_04870 [Epibacterium sp.]